MVKWAQKFAGAVVLVGAALVSSYAGISSPPGGATGATGPQGPQGPPGTGDVVGPASAVDNRIVSYNGATGKLVKDSGILSSTVLISGGALGTPASGVGTNITGVPLSTGISGLGTGNATALGVNIGSAGAFLKNNGDAFSGTYTGAPTLSGNLTFSGVPKYTGLSAGTQTKCLGLDSSNNVVYSAAACGAGGGGSANAGVSLAAPADITPATMPATGAARIVNRCGLTYIPGTTSPTGVYGEVQNTASGVYWQPQYTRSAVRACEFGTVADGSYNFTTGVATGTDNAPMIQAALNYAMQNSLSTVCIDDGFYKTADTLHQGWGNTFYEIQLVSCNGSRAAFESLQGVQILPTQTDRCAVSIQGGRRSQIRGIGFLGKNYPYVIGQRDAGGAYPITAAGWLDPTLVPSGSSPGGLQQHSAYSAICVDAYSGSAPADAYPNRTYPAWTGLSAQYGGVATSDVELTNISCVGFAVCVNSKPAADGQGDFVKVDKMGCEYSVYCISIGNTQARSTSIKNVIGNRVFAVLTNKTFGVQIGVLDGPIENISLGESYEFFDVGVLSYNGGMMIKNLYAEAIVRIGSFSNGGAFPGSIVFDGCDISLYNYITQVIPQALIEVSSGTAVPITLHSCTIGSGAGRINTLVHGTASVVIDGGAWKGGEQLGTIFNDAGVQRALNYTGSMLVGASMTYPVAPGFYPFTYLKWMNPTIASFMSAANSSIGSSQRMGANVDFKFSSGRRGQFTQATTGFYDAFNNKQWNFSMGPTGALTQLSDTAADVSVAATYTGCDTMAFTYKSSRQAAGNPAYNLTLGDILYHEDTGTIWVVTVIGAADGSGNFPITGRQMNNMVVNPSTEVCVTSNNAVFTGFTYVIHTGVQNIPNTPHFGTFTSGSVNVTSVDRGDGYGGELDLYVLANDKTYGYAGGKDPYFQWPYAAGASIATRTNGSPGSATLSANATASGRFPILPLPVAGGPQ